MKTFLTFWINLSVLPKLNGWNDDDLPIGLPLYLKGQASAWFKCLQCADEMTFDELSTAL